MPSTDLFCGKTPSKFQREVLADDHRYLVVAGNRGSRKTTACLWRIFEFCNRFPGVEGFIGRMVKKDLFKTTLSLWRQLFPRNYFGHLYREIGGTEAEPDYIVFANGSKIHLMPMSDIDRVRGANMSFFFIDQLEECPSKVWRDAVKVLRGPIVDPATGRDISAERRLGLATVNKTAKWYWIKRLFSDGIGFDKKPIDPEARARMHVIEPPYTENRAFWESGYYDDIIAAAESAAEIDFEVYGRDPTTWGLVFPTFARGTHTGRFEFPQRATYCLAYDEGFDVPSAFLFMALTPDEGVWIRAEHYAARMTLSEHAREIRRIAAKIGFPLDPRWTMFVADRAVFGKMDGNGRSIADQWGVETWPWTPGPKDPMAEWQRMRTLMERGLFHVHEDDCPNFLAEIEEAEYDSDKPGQIRKRCRDHALSACGYACLAALTPPPEATQKDISGTWREFRKAQKDRKSWVSAQAKPRLFLPRAVRPAHSLESLP